MANKVTTLADLAKLTGNDQLVGVVDSTTKVSPEVDRLLGRPIAGTSYTIPVRTARPSNGFRDANEGVELGKSEFAQISVQCRILDCQLQADKAVADAHPFGRDEFLTDELESGWTGEKETIGTQLFYGDAASSKGFQGVGPYLNATEPAMRVNAGGSTADAQTSAYLIFNDVKGTHFVFGANGALSMQAAWAVQQVTKDNKSFTAYTNGLTGWVGLQITPGSVSRVANLDATHPLTDELIASAIKLHKLDKKPTYILINRTAAFQLQKSRSATTNRKGNGDAVWAAEPVESNGVPLIITDSIVDTESVVSFA